MKSKLILSMAAAAIVACAAPVDWSTASPAYSFSTALTTTDAKSLSFGFQFTTNELVTLSALGYYDHGGDGLAVSHDVGIFDSMGALLYSTTVEAGTGASLIGDFRYTSIPLLSLAANQVFTIAATTGGAADEWAYGVLDNTMTGFVTDPAIEIAQNAARFLYTSGDCLEYPTKLFKYSIYAGPNFLIHRDADVVTPEPGAGLLLGSALGALLLLRRRQKLASIAATDKV
jgi:hypothetical protein